MHSLSYFFRLFLPVALLLVAGAWLYGAKEVDSVLTQVRTRDEANVRVGTAALYGKLQSLGSDLIFLASHSTTSVAVNRPTPENIKALADDFITFSVSKSNYDQIRWIDETGMERIRVDLRQGSPVLIPSEQLQDKSKRYFFIETIKLKPGEVFTSPLDLNIEHDQVEVPFKPMLRIATPVADQNGISRGIVILNYLGSDLLQAFSEAAGQTAADHMLVNSEGYWLKSDNAADEWGFMLNRPELTMATRSPAVWQRIRNSDQGQIELNDGLWTWKTLHPLYFRQKAAASSGSVSGSYFWKVIAHEPAEVLFAVRLGIWLKLGGIVGLFLGVYGIGSWKLAKLWGSQAALKIKYRTVADFAYDWETWIDPSGNYLYCSPSCARITGHSAQAFLTNSRLLTEIVHSDDLGRVAAHLQHHDDVDKVCQLAFRIVRSNGEICWLEHVCQPVFDAKGAYLGRRASNRDITERKQIEARLRAAKDSLNDAQRIAHIGSWTLNLASNDLIWSDEIFRLFEIDPNRFAATYEAFLNAVHPDDRDAVNQAFTESLSHREPYDMIHRLLMSDGRIKWVHERCTTDFDETGKPVRSQGTVQDITERKQIEDSFRKLSLAVEQSPSSIVITDLDANIEFANEAFFRTTGYSPAEAIGLNPRVLKSGKTPKETYDELWATLGRGQSWTGEFINQRKDGNEYVELALISPVHQPDGSITHYLAIKEDITNRKQAEIALRESHQQMYSLLNSMAEGAYGVDTDGNCKFVNRSFLRILGYEHADEVIGKHIHELIHHSHPDGSPYPAMECRMYAAYRHNEEVHVVDEVFWRKDGIAVPVEYRSQPIITNEVIIGAIATFVDISERKQAEEAAQLASQYARSLIEASLDPLVTISAKGKITDVNTATEQATGVDRGHLIGSDFADYFTDPDQARAGYQLAFLYGSVTDYPLSIRHASGKVTDVLYNATVYRDANGKTLGVFAAARDITERKQIEARLIDSESHLRTIIENEPECIKIVDADGCLVQMNPAGLKMIEADSMAEVAGKPVLDVIAPEYRKAYAALHHRVIAGDAMQMEYEVIGIKGGRRWLDTHAVPMKEANGNVVHLAVTRDISERKQSEHQLRIAATVFESQEGMLVTDADNNILRVNKAFSDVTGYSAEDVVGKNPRLLHSGRHNRDFYTTMWESINNTGSWEGEIWNRRKNGEIYPDYLTITAVKDHDGIVSHYVGTHMDITLRKAAAEEIERLAFYDPLTKLPNRRLLQDRLKPAMASSHRSGRHGALLFIDLDNFKILNDTLGHDMGDLLLQQVAERLNSCVREGDTVARLGGDEFVIMLQDLSEQPLEAATQAEITANKILAALNEPYQLGIHDYTSTPSIGAALFSDHEQTVDELLKHADIAMYHAKTSGRNALRFFDPQMQNAITTRFLLEDELRKALDRQHFHLYYQLQVDSTLRPLGAEALIRWAHPEHGLMSPAEFIPLAEETGLIHPIGQWVMESACAQLKAWQQSPLTCDLVLSVNVSAKQFFQADFAKHMQATILHHAINPMLLKLELTESTLIKNIEDTIATMNVLGQMGVQFSLDDFGTGYSSLQYLKKLPLNQLKIDQSFIRDIVDDNGGRAIVRTIIAMAESLNLNVIAEGVESELQRQFLFSHGCANYQGYLFSEPVPIAQFEALLRKR
jgi:diguanylate cyclase (GGDEF)-like protein/PAS domain S-box-containing protein